MEIQKLDCAKFSPISNGRVQNYVRAVQAIVNQKTQMILSKWHLAGKTSSKGQKTCQLTNVHKSITFHLGSNLKTRFGASTFDKNVQTSRKSLDFDITTDTQILSMLKEIDDWAIEYLHTKSARIMKVMSKDIIRETTKNWYHSTETMCGSRPKSTRQATESVSAGMMSASNVTCQKVG